MRQLEKGRRSPNYSNISESFAGPSNLRVDVAQCHVQSRVTQKFHTSPKSVLRLFCWYASILRVPPRQLSHPTSQNHYVPYASPCSRLIRQAFQAPGHGPFPPAHNVRHPPFLRSPHLNPDSGPSALRQRDPTRTCLAATTRTLSLDSHSRESASSRSQTPR